MKNPYLKTFFSAFVIFLVSILPILAVSGGKYMSFGDYNEQSVIFAEHISNLLRSEEGLPAWDWRSDLGMDSLISYGGFMFSPFVWLLYAVPVKLMPYVHSFAAALKIGLSALFAYVYCRKYVQKDSSAYICGMLYAFSGFQLFNLCFQFADTICLFPLTLYCFDELVTRKKPGAFALMLALNGFINYYFLWEECVFLLIYYIVKTVKKDYPPLEPKLFLRLAAETLSGVAASAAVLLPSALSILHNQRAGKLIFDANILAYNDDGVIMNIIQSLLLPPSLLAYGWYFDSRQLEISPPALFIPLFTVIGVSAVFRRNKGSWENLLLAVCAVIACIPLLNSVFSMLNYSYYSRWFYMPLLIMIMMTGKYIDGMENFNVGKELKISAVILGVFIVFGVYFVYIDKAHADDDTAIKNLWLMSAATSAAGLGIMYVLAHPNQNVSIFSAKNLGKIVCAMCLAVFIERSAAIVRYDHGRYIPEKALAVWNDGVPVDIGDDSFFRVSTCGTNSFNASLIWGYPSVDLFNSLVTGQESSFYEAAGFERNQRNNLTNSDHAMLTFMSVKYWFHFNEPTENDDLIDPAYVFTRHEGFNDLTVYNRYLVYENSAFIPMGFTYDHYIDIADFTDDDGGGSGEWLNMDNKELMFTSESKEDEISPQIREKLLLKAIWLDKDQIARYSDILSPLPAELAEDTSDESYYEDCKKRASSSCYEFIPNGNGFNASINLEKDNLVFFSVPYSNGFTAYVDGEETGIEQVFGGLMAVYVPKGGHRIVFEYETPGLKTGICISIAGAAFIVIYAAADLALKKAGKKSKKI